MAMSSLMSQKRKSVQQWLLKCREEQLSSGSRGHPLQGVAGGLFLLGSNIQATSWTTFKNILGDSLSLIKNLIPHKELKGLLLLNSHRVNEPVSNEPLDFSSLSLILSQEIWKPLHVAATKRKTIYSSERLFYFQGVKIDDSIHMSDRENRDSIERYLLGLCDFKENMPFIYLWEPMAFSFSAVEDLFATMQGEGIVKEKEESPLPFLPCFDSELSFAGSMEYRRTHQQENFNLAFCPLDLAKMSFHTHFPC